MRLCVADAYGAFGLKHLEALAAIDDAEVTAIMGPNRARIDALAAERGIAMDMAIGLKSADGAICTLSLSFNNDGPATFFRYICDSGTYLARYDDLYDGRDAQIDLSGVAVSSNGIELIDREFISAITEGRTPNAAIADVLPCMETLHRIETSMR